jgi:hypothetical protein
MAKYYIPLHNLSVFNPAEFPTTDTAPVNVKGLTQIASTVATNQAIVDSNTIRVSNKEILFTATIPTATFRLGTLKNLAIPGATVPTNVPFMLIVNLNLDIVSTSIDQITCYLINTVAGTNQEKNWKGTGTLTTTADIKTTLISCQFVFFGVGNGSPYTFQFGVDGVGGNPPLIDINTYETNGYLNDIFMYYL